MKRICLQFTRPGLNPWEDPLEKGTNTHSSILAWRIPWTRSLAVYIQSMGCKESDTTEQPVCIPLHFNEGPQDSNLDGQWSPRSCLLSTSPGLGTNLFLIQGWCLILSWGWSGLGFEAMLLGDVLALECFGPWWTHIASYLFLLWGHPYLILN